MVWTFVKQNNKIYIIIRLMTYELWSSVELLVCVQKDHWNQTKWMWAIINCTIIYKLLILIRLTLWPTGT